VCAKEAVQLFKTYADEIDLLILDVMMPVMTGPVAYSEIAAIRPAIQVIFTTGYASEDGALKSMQAKGLTILQKPYGLKHLSKVIRELIDQPSLV
jgi:two-component system, cell cycle sensor histidine kinase and response regulator CckA